MRKIHRFFALCTLLLLLPMAHPAQCNAQQDTCIFELQGYGLYDRYLAIDDMGGGALMGTWHSSSIFDLGIGIEWVSAQRVALNVQGKVKLHTFSKGTLYIVNRYMARYYTGYKMQEFTSAALMGWQNRHWQFELGLCNRWTADLVQRTDGGRNTILEPMNIMFGVEGYLFDASHNWNVGGRWSNYNDFIIERFANWFYSLKGYYQLPHNTRFTAEVGIHPAGSLNLTSSYNGWFMHLGALKKF